MASLYRYMLLVENPVFPDHYERIVPNFALWGHVVEACSIITRDRGAAKFLILRGYTDASLEMAYQRLLGGDTVEAVVNDYYGSIEQMSSTLNPLLDERYRHDRSHDTFAAMSGMGRETAQGSLASQMGSILSKYMPPAKQPEPAPEPPAYTPKPGSWTEWRWNYMKKQCDERTIGGEQDGHEETD